MAIKLIESLNTEDNAVAQYPENGAAINFLSCYKKSGRAFGAVISYSGKTLSIGAGLLIARGYRIWIDSTTVLKDLTGDVMPAVSTVYHLLLTITRSSHNATFAIGYFLGSLAITQNSIDQVDGTYQLILGTLVLDSNGIMAFTDTLTSITPPSGTSGSSIGSILPAPQLEIVQGRKGGAYNGWLAIKNKGDYNLFSSSYTVEFWLYRYVRKGKYRDRSGSTKVYFSKTGFVQPTVSIGWGTAKITPEILFSQLQTVTVRRNDTFSYVRKDIVAPISDYVGAMFYDAGYDSGTGLIGASKTAITESTNAFAIRSTRSSKGKHPTLYSHHSKHNFFIFAYRAFLYSGSTRIAASPFSQKVVIAPNLSFESLAEASSTTIAGKFRILIE
jgi:hypothetical protein